MLKKVLVPSILAMLVSCKPTVPSKYIQPDEMESILYDYHLADGLAVSTDINMDNSLSDRLTYHEAVFKKYGINQAEFDSSMVYYFRHTDRLHDIYENISKRLTEDARNLGASNVNGLGVFSPQGDTTNIWRGPQTKILLPTPPENKLTFVIEADTSFHKGDLLMLNFDNLFIVQEGMKELNVVFSMRLSNDSIVSKIQRFSNNSHNSIRIEDDKRIGIKEVKGLFLLPNNLNDKSQSYKLVCLYNIQLVKIHAKETSWKENLLLDNTENKDALEHSEARNRNMPAMAQPDRIR